jgi:hypothetical protein
MINSQDAKDAKVGERRKGELKDRSIETDSSLLPLPRPGDPGVLAVQSSSIIMSIT